MLQARIDQIKKWFAWRPALQVYSILRISVALVLLLQIAWIKDYFLEFMHPNGLIQQNLKHFLVGPHKPQINWFIPEGTFSAYSLIYTLVGVYIGSLVLMLFGILTRLSSILVWFTHYLIFMSSSSLASYGIDSYAHVALFYMMFMPLGSHLSVDSSVLKLKQNLQLGALFFRFLQIHFAFTYVVAGVAKSFGSQWYTGEAVWRAMILPEFAQFDVTWLLSVPWVALAAGLGTLVLEIFYPLFAWQKRYAPLWISAIISMHLGIALFLGLYSFSILMITLNICLFLAPLLEFSSKGTKFKALSYKYS